MLPWSGFFLLFSVHMSVCASESVKQFGWFVRCGATCSDEEDSAESTTDEDNVEDNTCHDASTDERYMICLLSTSLHHSALQNRLAI